MFGSSATLKLESPALVENPSDLELYTNLAVVPIEVRFVSGEGGALSANSFTVTNGVVVGEPTKVDDSFYLLDVSPSTDGLVEVRARSASSNTLRFMFDSAPPGIQIGEVGPEVGNDSSEFVWDVSYTDASTVSLSAGDVNLQTTGTVAGCVLSIDTTGVLTREIKIVGCTGEGTIGFTIDAGTAEDFIGNVASTASTDGTAILTQSYGVTEVFAANHAFAALRADGTIAAWGNAANGGTAPAGVTDLNSGVVTVVSASGVMNSAFAALKADGTVVAWGDAANGGTAPAGVTSIGSRVVKIVSTFTAFAALKADGSVVTWGAAANGGDSTGVVFKD